VAAANANRANVGSDPAPILFMIEAPAGPLAAQFALAHQRTEIMLLIVG
jgi:hypothetical protein